MAEDREAYDGGDTVIFNLQCRALLLVGMARDMVERLHRYRLSKGSKPNCRSAPANESISLLEHIQSIHEDCSIDRYVHFEGSVS